MGLFSRKKKLFGNNVEPACEYCEYGKPSGDGAMILCSRKGIVTRFYSCSRFRYMPTKRIPRRRPDLPRFDRKDFSLEDESTPTGEV